MTEGKIKKKLDVVDREEIIHQMEEKEKICDGTRELSGRILEF